MTELILAGPGRAGGAIALAARRAGHRVVGVLARRAGTARAWAERLEASPLRWDLPLPTADLLVTAVRDDAIGEVAARLSPHAGLVGAAVHLSGFAPLAALDPFREAGLAVGSLHPLQTIPDPETGAAALTGAWAAVTAGSPGLARQLDAFAGSLGLRPFPLADPKRALYHAGTAAASNYLVGVLGLGKELLAGAGVPFEAVRLLAEAIVANVFELGPDRALTGPVARGDLATVAGHLAAVRQAAPELLDDFIALAQVTARLAGRLPELARVLEPR
ncbi:MAG: Rossmann-like and DUF2520 domain-containing protein [Acidimicrobiia bacterium]